MSNLGQGQYVIKNDGKVVRVLQWNSTKAYIVFLIDDQRVEIVENLKDLDTNNVRYKQLSTATRAQVKKTAKVIAPGLTLEFDKEMGPLAVSEAIILDETETYKDTLKWSFIGHVASLLLCLLVGFLMSSNPEEEMQVVEVIKQDRLQKIKPKPKAKIKTAKVRKTKLKKKFKKAKLSNRNRKRKVVNTRKKVARKTVRTKKKASSMTIKRGRGKTYGVSSRGKKVNMGALGALGNPGKGRRGANLSSIGKGSGRGTAKGHGAGVGQKALYGKGLVSSAVGSGQRVGRYKQGYGTRGMGGGGSASYGRGNIKGNGGSYIQPLYEEALVQGGLDRSMVEAVIQRNRGKFTYCYEKGLQRKPNLSGRVSVKFVINPQGRVKTANIQSSSLRYSSVEGCIVSQMKSLKFPKPAGRLNVKVTYPFELRKGYVARR